MADRKSRAVGRGKGLAATQCFSRSHRETARPSDATLIREATAYGERQSVLGCFRKTIVDDRYQSLRPPVWQSLPVESDHLECLGHQERQRVNVEWKGKDK
jgi:hypothetical protein